MQQKTEKVIALLKAYLGTLPLRTEMLPASGSQRQYYRLYTSAGPFIGVYHADTLENRLFIDFSRHFRAKGLPVPEIFAVSDDGLVYLQEDLGEVMLLDFVGQHRKGNMLDETALSLYKKVLFELLRFQFLGREGLDYSHCIPRPVFDRRCIAWDLNYFKYCFLRLSGVSFSEDALEDDFEHLLMQACSVPADAFMFRDFQSRNIMVRGGKVWFIDYQGGRKGALHYDVASLLYDAVVEIPEQQREELLQYYITELQNYRKISAEEFIADYYRFVLIRLLQAMGAFGLRGLYEKKQHFIDSIAPGVRTICVLLSERCLGKEYPELQKVFAALEERF